MDISIGANHIHTQNIRKKTNYTIIENNYRMREKFKTYQNPVEGRRWPSTLHVTKDSNTGVLLQVVHNHFFHKLSCNRLAFTIYCTLRYYYDIQTLTGFTFLVYNSYMLLFYQKKDIDSWSYSWSFILIFGVV